MVLTLDISRLTFSYDWLLPPLAANFPFSGGDGGLFSPSRACRAFKILCCSGLATRTMVELLVNVCGFHCKVGRAISLNVSRVAEVPSEARDLGEGRKVIADNTVLRDEGPYSLLEGQ